MHKYTSGQWSMRPVDYVNASRATRFDIDAWDHDAMESCTVAQVMSDDLTNPDQVMANASLIATAPDLLFALSAIVAEIKYLVEDGTLPASAMNHPAVKHARNAIDRAKG